LEWRAVGRIECLLKVLGDKNQIQKKLEAYVKGPQVSTKPLDLKYCKTDPCVTKQKCQLPGLSKKKKKKKRGNNATRANRTRRRTGGKRGDEILVAELDWRSKSYSDRKHNDRKTLGNTERKRKRCKERKI